MNTTESASPISLFHELAQSKQPDADRTASAVRIQETRLVRALRRRPRLSVLLVEDCDSDAELVMDSLAQATDAEFQVDRATTVEAAMRKLLSGQFDIVLLDLNVPPHYGLETLTHVRKAQTAVPLVVLSARDDLVGHVTDYGADCGYLKRSVNGDLPGILLDVIEQRGLRL